jgi:2-C-methyl-D-erythritol 4-phosphate cytidylyltransferase
MVVVAAGSSVRFRGDKLLEQVAGMPLIAHTVAAVRGSVGRCVLVGRASSLGELRRLDLDAEVVAGGATRTLSEMAGLAALGDPPDLIGIHDGARPLVTPALVETLFGAADELGGAVPVLAPDGFLLEKATLRPAHGLVMAQTPQVFRGPELMAAYVRAAQAGFDGTDTAEVVGLFSDLEVAAIAGEPDNIKVTFPADLEVIRGRLTAPSRNGLR